MIIADEGGFVGVGTLSPAWKFDVNGQIATRGQAVLDATATDIVMGDVAGGDGYRDNLYLCTHDTKRVVIDGTGRVGIGSLSPDEKLYC